MGKATSKDIEECHPYWLELAQYHFAQVYKTTGISCGFWMCLGYEYNRLDYKKEALQMIRNADL